MLAAAIFMRLFVPAGWMPVADASGLHFELCRGQLARQQPAPVAEHHMHHAGHQTDAGKGTPEQEKHADQPCAFAGLGMALLDVPDPSSTALLSFPVPTPATPPAIIPRRGLAAPPPPATGPPSFA